MERRAGTIRFIISFLIAGAFLNTVASADDETIARGGARRPMGGYQSHGRYGDEMHPQNPQQYHPEERNAAREDLNRNQDLNALDNAAGNAAVPEAYPAYPAYPQGPQGGNNININTAPQGNYQNPQH